MNQQKDMFLDALKKQDPDYILGYVVVQGDDGASEREYLSSKELREVPNFYNVVNEMIGDFLYEYDPVVRVGDTVEVTQFENKNTGTRVSVENLVEKVKVAIDNSEPYEIDNDPEYTGHGNLRQTTYKSPYMELDEGLFVDAINDAAYDVIQELQAKKTKTNVDLDR